MKRLKVTAARVIGTNQSQASIQSKIWSLTINIRPPTLWLMINPSDLHDPIAQVFCGEAINLDAFDRIAGPNKTKQKQNSVQDPFTAAHFFNFLIKMMLEKLVGIEVSGY